MKNKNTGLVKVISTYEEGFHGKGGYADSKIIGDDSVDLQGIHQGLFHLSHVIYTFDSNGYTVGRPWTNDEYVQHLSGTTEWMTATYLAVTENEEGKESFIVNVTYAGDSTEHPMHRENAWAINSVSEWLYEQGYQIISSLEGESTTRFALGRVEEGGKFQLGDRISEMMEQLVAKDGEAAYDFSNYVDLDYYDIDDYLKSDTVISEKEISEKYLKKQPKKAQPVK